MRRPSITILFCLTLWSCDNNYNYIDSEGKSETIKAANDGEAYTKAFTKFQIDKKIKEKTSSALGLSSKGPIYFDLYDSKGQKVVAHINEDSLERRIENSAEKVTENLKDIRTNSIYSDTAKLQHAPIKITKARFYQEEYSNYKDVSLTFKNISNKKVTAIRFRWYGENAFGEPADMSGFVDGWGGGFTDKTISPGRSMTLQWSVLSRDGKKILVAYPTEAMFVDGTKWKIE